MTDSLEDWVCVYLWTATTKVYSRSRVKKEKPFKCHHLVDFLQCPLVWPPLAFPFVKFIGYTLSTSIHLWYFYSQPRQVVLAAALSLRASVTTETPGQLEVDSWLFVIFLCFRCRWLSNTVPCPTPLWGADYGDFLAWTSSWSNRGILASPFYYTKTGHRGAQCSHRWGVWKSWKPTSLFLNTFKVHHYPLLTRCSPSWTHIRNGSVGRIYIYAICRNLPCLPG